MKVEVSYQDGRVDLDVPEDRLVATYRGPADISAADLNQRLGSALEHPLDYPPLRQGVVPGDRVVIALGAGVPEAAKGVASVCRVLELGGVDAGSILVLAEPDAVPLSAGELPPGVSFRLHDPDDRSAIAYLANNSAGRRVYLARDLTDADAIVPIGRLSYDGVLGYGGPWAVVFPGLSDTETKQSFRATATPEVALGGNPATLTESLEVSWLLGCQFQVGVLPGMSGVHDVLAGLTTRLVERGRGMVDEAWGFRPSSRAELVVAGVGHSGSPTTLDDLAHALATASRLVQRGGKVVILSAAEGDHGPAWQRLVGHDDPRSGLKALKGFEAQPDYASARLIAEALAWADIYLLSRLDNDLVEDLSMIPLERPAEAQRLVALSGSVLVLSRAESVWARVSDPEDRS